VLDSLYNGVPTSPDASKTDTWSTDALRGSPSLSVIIAPYISGATFKLLGFPPLEPLPLRESGWLGGLGCWSLGPPGRVKFFMSFWVKGMLMSIPEAELLVPEPRRLTARWEPPRRRSAEFCRIGLKRWFGGRPQAG
jgi:hypothetical protein